MEDFIDFANRQQFGWVNLQLYDDYPGHISTRLELSFFHEKTCDLGFGQNLKEG
jgi:hypothetical protein